MVKKEKKIILFSSPGCSWCNVAKNFFKTHKIKFKEIDISRDIKASQDCQRHGCKGVPVVLIGSKWICGFDQKKIEKTLEI